MKIGAYSFPVTGNIDDNFVHIHEGIKKASGENIRLLLFPECAVTGYPPHDIRSADDIDLEKAEKIHRQIQTIAEENQIYIVAGTIIREDDRFCNTAMVFCPDGTRTIYRKRALWGWDRDNFSEGHDQGIIQVDSLKVGIRICFEVRFPEYFRELYKEQTDLNLILF